MQRAELLERLRAADEKAEWGPWLVTTKAGDDWLICYGFSDDDGDDLFVTTDHLHASECKSKGARADAEAIAEMRNLLPEIIAALSHEFPMTTEPEEPEE